MSDPEVRSIAGPADVRFGADGLVTVVAQDAFDGRVLMVGHADAEAVAASLATGLLHLHSRSRGRLWRKGEESGNVLRLRSLAADCDSDALLAAVEPAGPTCHRGTRSCFDADGAVPAGASGASGAGPEGFAWLEALWRTIADRAATRPHGSYTVSLLEGGVDAAARKVAEEATELLMAAKDDAAGATSDEGPGARDLRRGAVAAEAADLLFHVLVLLAERGLPARDVIDVLRARHGMAPRERTDDRTTRGSTGRGDRS